MLGDGQGPNEFLNLPPHRGDVGACVIALQNVDPSGLTGPVTASRERCCRRLDRTFGHTISARSGGYRWPSVSCVGSYVEILRRPGRLNVEHGGVCAGERPHQAAAALCRRGRADRLGYGHERWPAPERRYRGHGPGLFRFSRAGSGWRHQRVRKGAQSWPCRQNSPVVCRRTPSGRSVAELIRSHNGFNSGERLPKVD
jgi:hypothetical protein